MSVRRLLPKLRISSGRVVSVASALHKKVAYGPQRLLASLLDDPMSERAYGMFEAYAKSKLTQVLTRLTAWCREVTGGQARRAATLGGERDP